MQGYKTINCITASLCDDIYFIIPLPFDSMQSFLIVLPMYIYPLYGLCVFVCVDCLCHLDIKDRESVTLTPTEGSQPGRQ